MCTYTINKYNKQTQKYWQLNANAYLMLGKFRLHIFSDLFFYIIDYMNNVD